MIAKDGKIISETSSGEKPLPAKSPVKKSIWAFD
jgi:hypothetical protein